MKKQEFLIALKQSLNKFSEDETREIIAYYNELITEQVEKGKTEEEIITGFGDIKIISAQISAELIESRMLKTNNIKKTAKNFLLILMICASPALLPLGIAFFAVFISLAAVAFALVVSFYAAAAALVIAIIPSVIYSYGNAGIGGALIAAGLTVFLASIFAALATVILKYSILLLNATVRSFAKYIKKLNRR